MEKTRKRKSSTAVKTYCVDELFRETTRNLIRDFQTNLSDPLFQNDVLRALNTHDVVATREAKSQMDFSCSVPYFKATYQVASIDKRYRYSKDAYTDRELQDMAVAKFLDVQSRLRSLDWDSIIHDERMSRILSGAQALCRHVLGDFSDAELRQRAKFGTGATSNVRAREANLAQRFTYPISGTRDQISWWKSEYDNCPHFQQWCASEHSKLPYGCDDMYEEIDHLKLTFVPKSYKALRAILANTTIGSYQSGGIGEMIRLRLRQKCGIDIKRAQHLHREICELESCIQQLCTVDLQSASDSLSVNLVKLLLPSEWYDAINLGCCRKVLIPTGDIVEVETFSTMGIGCTFTLQTLVFYSILWSIQANEVLQKPKGLRYFKYPTYVYGDDLIFGSIYYEQAREVFEKVGILVNDDKSFVNVPFRESCGGDFYRGWDVRPFQPEVSVTSCSAIEYEAMLYKFINGLLLKWEEHEVWTTLHYLVSRLERVTAVKLVPLNFPDDSGIRVEGGVHGGFIIPEFLRSARCAKPKFVGHGLYRITCLGKYPKKKEELRHGPYYWSCLRSEPLSSPHGFAQERGDDWSPRPFPVRKEDFPLLLWVDTLIGVKEPAALLTREKLHPSLQHYFSPYDLDLPYGPAPGDSPPSARNNLREYGDFITIPHTSRYRSQPRTVTFVTSG